jgi:Helix-turn-helix domain
MESDGKSKSKTDAEVFFSNMSHGERLRVLADLRRSRDENPEVSTAVPELLDYVKMNNEDPLQLEASDCLMDSIQAAKLLGYSVKGFRNLVSSGKIPMFKILGRNRFKRSELLSLAKRVHTKD